MNEHAVLIWIQDSWLGVATRDIPWLFPTFETLHFLGLCILLGAMLIVDLRLLGVFADVEPAKIMRLSYVAAGGLLLNLVSGIGFFSADAIRYWANPAFQLKTLLLAAAFVNIAIFELGAKRRVLAQPANASMGAGIKILGALSLTLWFVILILGRLLPDWDGLGGFL
jgi:disulfide bond formation protein DsbB